MKRLYILLPVLLLFVKCKKPDATNGTLSGQWQTINLTTSSLPLFATNNVLCVKGGAGYLDIQVSQDQGNTWKTILGTGSSDVATNAVTDLNGSSRIILQYTGSTFYTTLTETDNYGDTSIYLKTPPQNNSNNGSAYANLIALVGSNIFCTSIDSLYLSSDNGNTWNGVLGLSAATPGNMYKLGTKLFLSTNNTIYLSTNNGNTWSSVNTGITGNLGVPSFTNYSPILSTTNGNIYTCSSDGVFELNNNTWDTITIPNSYGIALVEDFTIVNNVLVASVNLGVYATNENNLNWVNCGQGLTGTNPQLYYFVMDSKYIYASTTIAPYTGGRIYRRSIADFANL